MYYLNELIDIDVIQEMQDRFAEVTGLAFVAIDYAGKPITKLSNFTDFCRMLRSDSKHMMKCANCDAHGGIEAASLGAPYVYKCHAGLIDFAVPIIAKGQYIGSILGGQIKTRPEDEGRADSIKKQSNDIFEDEKIIEAYKNINVISYDKIVSIAELLSKVTGFMVEKTIMNMSQDDLNKKNIELLEEVKIKASLEKALKNSEIKALQAQVNPHFTFNVLNTIVRLAIVENAEKTQELTYLFAELLRYIIRNVNNDVTIEDEINQVRRYFEIQKIRFGDRMSFSFDVDSKMNQDIIPSMIIQPMVENAMKHGIETMVGTGIICVKGYQTEEDNVFEIIDNGVGMSEKMINKVLSRKDDESFHEISTGLGIANTNERLILNYGLEYGLKICSKIGEGTTITLRVPK